MEAGSLSAIAAAFRVESAAGGPTRLGPLPGFDQAALAVGPGFFTPPGPGRSCLLVSCFKLLSRRGPVRDGDCNMLT